MITWMLWATGFAALVCVAAFASERVAGVFGIARRQVWMVALVAAAVVPPLLATQANATPEPEMVLVEEFPAGALVAGQPRAFVRPPIVRTGAPRRPARVAPIDHTAENRVAIALWALASLTLALVFARTMLRLRRESAGWPEVAVGSYRALLAHDAGPAVIGFAKPRIVIPEWALSLDEPARELMLRHEAEHIRVRDPRTLVIAGALLTMFPWNAAMWLIVRQLRRAMEFDCDARVIRSVGNAGEYGRVLLTVGERFTAPLPLAASLSAPRPLLEQRIDVMTTPRSPRPLRAALPFIALALLASGGAARAPRPDPLSSLAFAGPHSLQTPMVHQNKQDVVRKVVPEVQDEDLVALAKSSRAAAKIDSPTDAPAPAVVTAGPALDRDGVLAIARASFPGVVSGDVPAKFLVLVFDANDRYLWGFPANSSVMVRVDGDTLTAQQRRALQTAQGGTVMSGGSSGRGGRGGGAVAPASAGEAKASFDASGTLSSSRRNSYLTTYGMTATRDSAGQFHPGPVNQDAGLVTVTPSGGESGIDGISARSVMYVDDFALQPDDRFSLRLQILAVHLNNVPADTAPREWVRVSSLIPTAGDTGKVAEKKKAKVKQLVVLPMPAPPGYTMRACYDVASDGEARLLAWTKSRDSTYNRKILESLSGYLFTPATLNGVAVRDTACINATSTKNGG